jgi:hypothetical protein
MGRRTFLGAVAGGAIALVAGGVVAIGRLSDNAGDDAAAAGKSGDVEPRAALTTLFGDPAAAARIGIEYRKAQPAAPTGDVFDGTGGADHAALASHISAHARTDWAAGSTVVVAGWVLPRTIAELAATAAREFPQ